MKHKGTMEQWKKTGIYNLYVCLLSLNQEANFSIYLFFNSVEESSIIFSYS